MEELEMYIELYKADIKAAKVAYELEMTWPHVKDFLEKAEKDRAEIDRILSHK